MNRRLFGRRRNSEGVGARLDEFFADDGVTKREPDSHDVFGAEELARVLNTSTTDRMGSVDFRGVARGPCRSCRKAGPGRVRVRARVWVWVRFVAPPGIEPWTPGS